MKKIITAAYFFLTTFTAFAQIDSLRIRIQNIVSSQKADVGVAISSLENPKDTLSMNGNKPYPLMSVVKFHTALTILNWVDQNKLTIDQKVTLKKEELDPDTYSPMRDAKPKEGFETTVKELLIYSVGQSDNIAYLKLVDLLGGIKVVNDFVKSHQIKGVSLTSTYRDPFEKVLQNTSTPSAANELLRQFYLGKILKKETQDFLQKIMTETATGPDRIKGLLPSEAIVVHKTGTAGWDEERKKGMAFNDIGVVTLPSGRHYLISVLITNSSEEDSSNAKIIAKVSKACWDYFNKL